MKTEAQTISSSLIYTMGEIKDYTLALSGGIDSSVLLYSSLEANNPPKECITFILDGNSNKDYLATRELCSKYKIPLKVVTIPSDVNTILKDTKDIISIIGEGWKVHVQSCWPYMYMCPQITTKNLVAGTWADYYCSLKKATNIARRSMSDVEFEAFYKEHRRKKYNNTQQSFHSMKKYIESFGINFIQPYNNDYLFSLAVKLDFKDWNMNGDKVKHKYLWYQLYKKWFDETGIFRQQSPMQIVTGIRTAHEQMLADLTINTNNNKDLLSIYNKIKNTTGQVTLI